MSTLIDRLQFNFDTTKFGTSLDLPEESVNTIESMATDIELTDWQLDDMANNDVIATKYYSNPLANVCSSVGANLNNLVVSISTISAPNSATMNLLNSTLNCIIQLDRFKSHTDNVSGVSETTGSANIPTYLTAINAGQSLVTLLYKTDGVANSLPALGSMTSLFIESDLIANNTSIGANCQIFINSVSSNTTSLSNTSINNIRSTIESLDTFLHGRWSHDWIFYENSVKLMDDYFKMSNFNNIGSTQSYLINNYIGTDKVKSNLANNNIVIPVTEPEVVPTPPSFYEYFNQF
jgi:hypothetical protein